MLDMLIFKFPSGPLSTNAILIGCPRTKRAAIIDPAQGSAELLLEKAEKQGLAVEKMFLTHSHWDHIADAHQIKAPLYVHPLDAKNVEHPGSDGIPLFFPILGVIPAHLYRDGDIVELGELKMEVIHTPGHSPGSVCLYFRSEQTLFSGDTLFKGTFGNLHLPSGQPHLMRSSLDKLAHLPPETRVIPGHGADTTIQNEKKILEH